MPRKPNNKPFSSTYQPPNNNSNRPKIYLGAILKKVLSKQYRCQDPETQRIKKILGAKGVMQVLVWEGLQGNIEAIKEILNRIDGRVIQHLKGEGFENKNIVINFHADGKPESDNNRHLLSSAQATTLPRG